MSVLIKGMDVEVARRICAYAGLKDVEESDFIAVPEPHGRLIDADKLYSIIKWHHDLFKGATNASDKARRDENLQVMCDIVDAPTVIEAEGK